MFAFVADVHLHADAPAKTAVFLHFLRHRASAAAALYLLGDVFDAWIGDDDDSDLGNDVAAALQALSATTQLFFLAGNRDFLLGDAYASRCGMTRISEDYQALNLYGTPTVLCHGDTLCTQDTAYQQWRRQCRQPAWKQAVLAQPLAARRQLAAQLRTDSVHANAAKADEAFAVDEPLIEKILQENGAVQLIHGHTHRPGRYALSANRWRWVLHSWDDQPAVLWIGPRETHHEILA